LPAPSDARVVCQGRSSSVISKAAAAVLSLNVCAMIQALGRAKALSSVYTGGMTHIAMPVPASTPITKTAAPIKTRAGRRSAIRAAASKQNRFLMYGRNHRDSGAHRKRQQGKNSNRDFHRTPPKSKQRLISNGLHLVICQRLHGNAQQRRRPGDGCQREENEQHDFHGTPLPNSCSTEIAGFGLFGGFWRCRSWICPERCP
jgi:hypothetical protein